MTELSFLIELLLKHDLKPETKDAVAQRIREVEAGLQTMVQPASVVRRVTQQVLASEPVAIVAQTPAAQAAMASRDQAIAESMAGKINKEMGRPKKF